MLTAILLIIGAAIVYYAAILTRAAVAQKAVPNLEALILGAVVNFFDALGIGSFATTTAWMKFRRMVPDRLIPPTMAMYDDQPTYFAKLTTFLRQLL